MIWENTHFWNGHERRCDDINPRMFDWWCDECKMAIRDKHVDDDCCPECGGELWDMEDQIAEYQECTGEGGELEEDDEGNLRYRED